MHKTEKRFKLLYIFTCALFLFLISGLFYMQIIKGEEYRAEADSKMYPAVKEQAPRGEITDRNGILLAGNKVSYSLNIIKEDMEPEEFNLCIMRILNVLDKNGVAFEDTFPVSYDGAQYTFKNENEKKAWFKAFGYKKYINDKMTPGELLLSVANNIYKIPQNLSTPDTRRILGVRYEAQRSGFSRSTSFCMVRSVPVSVVSEIKESPHMFPCVVITNSFDREYYNNGSASHIIGRVGKISEDEYSKYKEHGYRFNDMIGKQGVEKLCEEELRGTDGVIGINNVPAVQGKKITLTLDIGMQQVLESSLESMIHKIKSQGGERTGGDADSGAAVVVDVNTGEILACASYPGYDISTFGENYSVLSADSSLPLWNRAISGVYSPGSIFKPLVAIAALESDKLKPKEKIACEGIYKFYEDYRPRCWIWSENNETHGAINVSDAIEKSCNCFFYEAGRRTGIDIISEYAEKFGLGTSTKTGLLGEVNGTVANPENKKKLVQDTKHSGWYGADTLQAAIGQSINTFTPLQLANYIATIANNGTRYKLSIIKDGKAEIEEKTDISSETLKAVKSGMRNVVEEGSAGAIFSGYPIAIGGKTGTAQVGSKVSNNALFAAFAPFDKPEIAICVVIEHGVRGANAAYVARDLFDYYFKDKM